MANTILKIDPRDNVWVALQDLQAGLEVDLNGLKLTIPQKVQAKHKFTEKAMPKGSEIIMYGILVGQTTTDIPQGGIVTTQNVVHKSADFNEKKANVLWNAPNVDKWKNTSFMGFHRPDGQVGVANYWLVIPLVFCENRNVGVIRNAFEEELGFSKPDNFKQYVRELVKLYKEGKADDFESVSVADAHTGTPNKLFKNVDGLKFLTHEGGCGGTRQDSEALCALLAGYINNPNVAGATVLSLGCQHAQTSLLLSQLRKLQNPIEKPLVLLEQQNEGTEQQLLAKAIRKTFTELIKIDKLERKPAPLSKLTIGLECGGSDGFSGISANPAVGHASDLMVALGGKTILSEFPELCGVEQELLNRCTTEQSAGRFAELMRAYEKSAKDSGSGFDMNPSPGNIRDGLITDAIKSAGAAKKGGTSPVADVLDYGEYVSKQGLNLLCTPGNDVESTTAMAGSGATIVLFTTGLGTPTGNPIAPVIKISTNTILANKMPDIIDIDAGTIIDGQKSIENVGEEILEMIIQVANGQYTTKAVESVQNDFIPWKRGVSL
ncbi:MAG: altronate dehydratase family protein [Cyclobacteriaceae bacterium]|nr:altronate dehydratase family protein [Cyclobacteriaceae bacterium]